MTYHPFATDGPPADQTSPDYAFWQLQVACAANGMWLYRAKADGWCPVECWFIVEKKDLQGRREARAFMWLEEAVEFARPHFATNGGHF